MRVRSELDGREFTPDKRGVEWVEAGRLPRTGRVDPATLATVRVRVSPAPGQEAWVHVHVPGASTVANDERMCEPVTLLDDGLGVDATRDPHQWAPPEALRIAALPTDEARGAALDEVGAEDMGTWMDISAGVRGVLAWRFSPALFCTGLREGDAELDEAESVWFRVRRAPEGGER
jgi:hypothetical protein